MRRVMLLGVLIVVLSLTVAMMGFQGTPAGAQGGAPGAQKSWKMPMVENVKKMAMESLARARGVRLRQKSKRLVRAMWVDIIQGACARVSVLLVGIPLQMRE